MATSQEIYKQFVLECDLDKMIVAAGLPSEFYNAERTELTAFGAGVVLAGMLGSYQQQGCIASRGLTFAAYLTDSDAVVVKTIAPNVGLLHRAYIPAGTRAELVVKRLVRIIAAG